jgi:hypothetical protein
MKRILFAILLISLFICSKTIAQKHNPVYVDRNGVMRWTETKAEVALFGVNYTLPFAHAFRAHDYLGVDHKKAIDADVYHFARLGLDAYRCHLWDSEISDSIGNIISTRQLDALDYLVSSLKKRGIKSILTLLKFGSNGYPERNTPTPGFSDIFGKDECLNNPETWPFQERFLVQFLDHVNPYTAIAYKDDPDIIAIEINNEPGHKNAELTRDYLHTMIKAIRSGGCKKPIFYNMSHNSHVRDEFLNSDLQGGTFQWYPSGLVSNHEQQGNFLPNIDSYPISFSDDKRFRSLAKMVYEFDPADLGQSYTYPVMARSFREAGFQFATQFAYDPIYMANVNTEYQTHYMNLAYAPQKGLSLKIASEVFHQIPINEDQGEYPGNSEFGDFKVSYEEDLAELVSEKKFIYTNHTTSIPPSNSSLIQIAGYGSSPVIKYEGRGAYFFDKFESGIWRLEVMPDAIWVGDPFERASPKKEVSVILWNKWSMSVSLDDLGEGFDVRGLDAGNEHHSVAEGGQIFIGPGTYLLTRKGIEDKFSGDETLRNITLKEFVAPETNCKKVYLLHEPVEEISEGSVYNVEATIVSLKKPLSVKLFASVPESSPLVIDMKNEGGYNYSGMIEAELIKFGFLEYRIAVEFDDQKITFPAKVEGSPGDWDFYARESWKSRIVKEDAPIYLFDAQIDAGMITPPGRFVRYRVVPSYENGRSLVEVNVRNLKTLPHDHSLRYCFKNKISGRNDDLANKKQLYISGASMEGKPINVQVALVMRDGSSYGGLIELTEEKKVHKLSLDELQEVNLVLLPAAYPTMMPYWFKHPNPQPFDISEIENVQISIGPGIPETEYDKPHGFALESIWLK